MNKLHNEPRDELVVRRPEGPSGPSSASSFIAKTAPAALSAAILAGIAVVNTQLDEATERA